MLDRRKMAAAALCFAFAGHARAEDAIGITYDDALARAKARSPDLFAARAREGIAVAEIGVASQPPNPSLITGTSTQAAKLSGAVSVPLLLLGQRGAAADASRAELATVKVETQGAWNEVRAGTARAFVTLWLAENTADTRGEAAKLVKKLENAVMGRIEVGSAPEVEGLRVRAERLRADVDADEARTRVSVAASDLGRFIGAPFAAEVRAMGDPRVPAEPPPLATLASRIGANPTVRREEADARAAQARAHRERVLVRPAMTLDVGFDAWDPSLPTTNYRAQLGVEVPLFHQRGPQIEREIAAENAANARAAAERTHALSNLLVAYRSFEATTARTKALAEGVVPAAEAAANATEDSYALGRAPLITVLDAERARLDARLGLLEARAARALAWIEVEHAVGAP